MVVCPFTSQLTEIQNGSFHNGTSPDGVSSRAGILTALQTRHVHSDLGHQCPGQHIPSLSTLEEISPTQKNSKEFYRVDAKPRLI